MAQGLVGSIFAAYGGLRAAQAEQERRTDEPRILFYAFLTGFLLFLIGLPAVRHQIGMIDAPNPMAIVLSARFFGSLFVLPLLLYGLAALAHVVALVFGGRATFQSARLSLFWALLVSMPTFILMSLLAAIFGSFIKDTMVFLGLFDLLAFARIWGEGLAQAEGFGRSWWISLLIVAIPIASFLAIADIRT